MDVFKIHDDDYFFSNVLEKHRQKKTLHRSSVRSKRANLLRLSIRRPPLQLLRRRPSTPLRNQNREPTNWRRLSSDVFTSQILSYNLVSCVSGLEVYGFDCNPEHTRGIRWFLCSQLGTNWQLSAPFACPITQHPNKLWMLHLIGLSLSCKIHN